MTTMGLKDLYAAAEKEGISSEGGGWKPTSGQVFLAEVARSNNKKTKNGFDAFGVQITVMDGEDRGKSFWDNISFSANAFGNGKAFGVLEALGCDKTFIDADPSAEAIAAKLVGAQATVTAGYRDNKGGGDPWNDHTYAPFAKEPEKFAAPAPAATGAEIDL